MSKELERKLHTHITERLGIYEDYLVEALNHDGISLTIISLGVPTAHESELKNLEHLRDAGLFVRDVRWSRSGRNKSYLYKLTKEGQELAEKIKNEKVEEEEEE